MILEGKFLVGDVGGTTTRLAIITRSMNILAKKEYHNTDIGSLDNAIKDFLIFSKFKPTIGCFAVAGPLNHERDHATLTNINWEIDAREIAKTYNLKKVVLLNDFEAIGLSIDHINTTQYTMLTTKDIDTKGIISVIGAGTGLGTSILYTSYGKHYPIASEGGHTDLLIDSTNALEKGFYEYLKKKKIPIETEAAVSGKGIINIYNYLLTKKIRHDKKVRERIKHSTVHDMPAIITGSALQDKDLLCIKTLELFIIFYARIARNLALLTLSATVFIAGGIARKILPALQDTFIEAFTVHEQQFVRKLLENISICVITDSDIAFYGCANALMS